jgi:hypothetical protein
MITDSKFSKKKELMMPDQQNRLMETDKVFFIGKDYIAISVKDAQ